MFDLENPVTTRYVKIGNAIVSIFVSFTVVSFASSLAERFNFYNPYFSYLFLLLRILFSIAFYQVFSKYVNKYVLNTNWSVRVTLNPVILLFLIAIGLQFFSIIYLAGIVLHFFCFFLARNHYVNSGSIQAKTVSQASIGIIFVEFFFRLLFT